MATDTLVANLISLAAEQRGLVTSRQAREISSVTPQQLKRLTDSGVLERLHHGLYRLARIPHDENMDVRVAWFAIDPGAVAWQRLRQNVPTGVVSHRTAAELHQLGDLAADVVELTATRRIRLSLSDVTIHRGPLTRDDWQIVDELPVTTPVRTIGDLAAASLDSGHLASIVRDALIRNLATTEDVLAVLAPHAFAYGYRALDGQAFLDALIEQAGVPVNTLALADIARRQSGISDRSMNSTQEPVPQALAASPLDPATLNSLQQAVANLHKVDPGILEAIGRLTRMKE
ncbi:type IV toxin-antitoxin system AbiEi family antitoxin domain-containing protein [Nocardia sp. NPDC019395]|uniref:type IV toxin-antitoxin system AbiEi family antitoxin domain-containing protein n=1 Tax=Nocardia sp. NPDC019395 TaxID=3154686 RepID=UPI0033E8A1B9